MKNVNYDFGNVSIKWFEDGQLNVSANCIDRHLATRGDQVAIIWEADDPQLAHHITYAELSEHVNKLANVYKSLGVGKGDRVVLYMPMIPEAAYAMLACARIGAIHSIVFAGFSPEALAARVSGCDAKLIVTRRRGPPRRPQHTAQGQCRQGAGHFRRHPGPGGGTYRRRGADDRRPRSRLRRADGPCQRRLPARTDECRRPAVHPLHLRLDRQPKGVLHTTGGYLVYASMTHQYVFDYHDGDIYWCTADVGWVTGHSYIVYGPLANGATTLMFEGVPQLSDAVALLARLSTSTRSTSFYTAPTAIRALMGLGDENVSKTSRASPETAGLGRRTDQSRSLGVVP